MADSGDLLGAVLALNREVGRMAVLTDDLRKELVEMADQFAALAARVESLEVWNDDDTANIVEGAEFPSKGLRPPTGR